MEEMMKEIGIITFHKSNNYGSVLQAYALQQAVSGLGYSNEIIDYEPRNYDYLYALFRKINSIDDVKYNLGNLKYASVIQRVQKAFEEFRLKYIQLTKESYVYGKSLDQLDNQYKNMICGSDQIWNPKAKDSDDNYFLPFLHKTRKISYAVSLNDGSLGEQADSEKYRNFLQDFSSLSVREDSARIALEQFLDKKVNVCLDPTLLHSAKKYNQLCSKKRMNEPYIFFYSIGYSFASVEAAVKIAERANLKVYVLYTGRGVKRVLRQNKQIRLITENVSPCDFLSYIKHADYVVTDSFHGTAFSIIYHKKFFSIGKLDEKGAIVQDSRICNILKLLQLEERFISAEEAGTINLDKEIDYITVDKKRKDLANESIQYLKTALQ